MPASAPPRCERIVPPRVSAADRVAADGANISNDFTVYDSVEAARLATRPWRSARPAAIGALLRGGPPWAV